MSGPRVQTFCMEKNSHMANDAFFLFRNKENKILFWIPQKGAGIQTVAIWLHAHRFVYTSSL